MELETNVRVIVCLAESQSPKPFSLLYVASHEQKRP